MNELKQIELGLNIIKFLSFNQSKAKDGLAGIV